MILVLDKRVKKKSKFVLELQKVYGLNKSTLLEVCRKFGLSHDIRVYEVPEFILRRVVRYIKHYYLVNTELSNKLLEEIR